MTGSTNSIESSLSPAPEQNTPAEPTSAGLDSGSELSELTDEEAEARNKSRRGNWRRRRRTAGSRRGGRKKRSNLVPAPMWGWAEQKANAAEEEEELSEPARAMEEEEGPEEEEEEEDNAPIADDKDNTVNDSDEDNAPIKALSAASEDEDQIDDDDENQPQPVSENETESEDDDDEQKTSKGDDMDVDVTATAPEDVPPIVAAAAASSIMAGSQIIDPPSPSSSDSHSATSSRAQTPIPDQSDIRKGKLSGDASAPDKPSDVEVTNEPTEDNDIDETVAEEDIEAELELQPAHRAEALDFLAIIELKFALLREKLYVEKMQALAWEETLIDRGTHPELLHLHKELSKRRDKRLELATRKRALEVANVNKRRRVDENATWSWWKLARDDLQTEMIAETNRKRRRLERERRAVERPQPARRIPNPPVEILIPPSVRSLVDSHSHGTVHLDDAPQLLVYPQLSTLSSAEVINDLELFYMNRQSVVYDPPRNSNAQMPHTALPQPPIGYEPYSDNAYPPRPLPVVPSGYHHNAGPPQQAMVGPGQAGSPFAPYGAGAGRPTHHHQNATGIHGPSPFTPDQDPGWSLPGPSSGVGFPPHALHNRRSISPPTGVKSNGQWVGPAMGGFHVGRESEEEERRDRERREREHQEMDRERQRDYHMQNLQQHHRHGHQHSHAGPPPQTHGVHHHHGRPHHHHVLHHHAPPPSGPTLSPRASRDIESRHPTEVINLSSNKGHWKEEVNDKRPGSVAVIIDERERERPLAMPFTMAASHHSPPRPTGGSTPPRNSWNQDDIHRPPMGHDSPGRYNRIGPLADRTRALPPPSPSSIPPQYGSPTTNATRSPTRYRERSPPPRLHRPLSPQSKNAPLLPPLSTPTSRVPSPLLPRGPGDRDQAISPRPPKMIVTQMID